LKPDLTGSNESLDDFLARLRTFSRKPVSPKGPPPDFGHFVTNRRPPRNSGGAEAPIPVERPLPDLYAVAV
jgi:hypothetical protein